MRKVFTISIVTLLFGWAFWKLDEVYLVWFHDNSFDITADSPLRTEDVKVFFGISVNSINRRNDGTLFDNMKKYSALFDGKLHKENMINEYGENDFLITYGNQYYCSFRHFKTNWKQRYEYDFHLFKMDGNIFFKADITGVEKSKLEIKMIAIDSASEYKFGVKL